MHLIRKSDDYHHLLQNQPFRTELELPIKYSR
jgi:hypothetical protein